jgi:ESS family glutamate:Na+ symporter
MTTISFDLIQTLGLAVIVLLVGGKIRQYIPVLQKYFIPSPVVGGLAFSLITFIGHQTGTFSIKLNSGMDTFLMVMFFTCTGFMASLQVVKRSGRMGLLLAGAAVALLFIQNGIGAFLADLFGLHPLLGVSMGSVSMSGGIGSAVAFGPTFEGLGVPKATLVGLAAATFGLVMGSLVGGPVARILIDKNNLVPNAAKNEGVPLEEKSSSPSSEKSIASSIWIVLLTMMFGGYLVGLLNKTGITFPYYVGGVFAATIVRNVADAKGYKLRMAELNGIGNISLALFLTLSLMSLKVWELLSLAVPMIVILAVQAAVMALYACFVTFRCVGKDYEAAVMAAGHCGVGLGQTPNAVANMATIIEKYGPAPTAWFMLPVITVIFINVFNPFVITLFMNYLK